LFNLFLFIFKMG